MFQLTPPFKRGFPSKECVNTSHKNIFHLSSLWRESFSWRQLGRSGIQPKKQRGGDDAWAGAETPLYINLTWSTWLLTPKPGTGGALRISCRNAWMCRSFQRNESAFNSGILHCIRKQAFSIQAENEQLLAYLQLYPWECQCMGKRKMTAEVNSKPRWSQVVCFHY